MKELLEMSFQISGTALILFIIVMLLGLAITSYIYFKLQDVTKWKDAYYTMAKELEIENGLYIKKDLERLKKLGASEIKNVQLEKEIAALKHKYERRDQPRDKGRFTVINKNTQCEPIDKILESR
jgi:cell division protein YceG involved in septum cleavage